MQKKNDDLISPPFMSPVIFTAHVCKEREEPADDRFFPLVHKISWFFQFTATP